MKISEIPVCDRPREKLLRKGPEFLKDAELLALILRMGSKKSSALESAEVLFSQFPLLSFSTISYEDIVAIPGVNIAKACSIIAAIELGKRIHKQAGEHKPSVTKPEDALILVADIANSKKEHFVVLYLNARNHLINREIISIGTVNASIVHPREVFEPAVRQIAAQLILIHNHPSGDPDPSDADITLTKRLHEVGKIMGIEVADHIIIAGSRYMSFREKGIVF